MIDALQPLDAHLLPAALRLAGIAETGRLVGELLPSLAVLPGFRAGGLCVADLERRLITTLVHGPEGPVPECVVEADPLQLAAPAGGPLEAEDLPEPLRPLRDTGARRWASAPLVLEGQVLGALVAAFEGEPAPGERAYLEDLARLASPILWSCFTRSRFARGDRRRDLLMEISRVLNTALEEGEVLRSAREAIGRLEGHRWSWIGLVAEDGRSFRRHAHPGDSPAVERPLAGSALAAALASGRTWASGDLARERRFPDDAELFARGVRRYLVTPLVARGRAIGGLLYGTADPHPILGVEVWLHENVALQLALALDNAVKHETLQRLSARRAQENVYLREELQRAQNLGEMIGATPAMRRVFENVARVARTDSIVLITGPTGVGKELVARAIHRASRRADEPLVKLNCAAIPEGMVESELFGHERGAFTSAVGRRIGRFELAQDGTLFLDEVGELPLGVQAKLLRVLQDGEFERVGGSETLTSNARIIAATNRELQDGIAAGSFRSDLYYRLNVFPIRVPPLDERREDIPALVAAFLDHATRRMGKRIESIEPASLDALCGRSWPGNVRELQHVIERAVILSDGPVLRIEEPVPLPLPARREGPPLVAGLATLEAVQAEHIRRALERCDGIIEGPRGAANLLGLKGSTLRFRMKRLGVQRPPRDAHLRGS